MSNYLVVYASKRGHTVKIARFIDLVLTKNGHQAHLIDLNHKPDITLNDLHVPIDGTILAGALTMRRHPKLLRRFIRSSLNFLNAMPCLVLTIGFMEPHKSARHQKRTQECQDLLKQQTGIEPTRMEMIAGAIPFKDYGLINKIMMSFMLRRYGVSYDPEGRSEHTDWDQLERIIEDFSNGLPIAVSA